MWPFAFVIVCGILTTQPTNQKLTQLFQTFLKNGTKVVLQKEVCGPKDPETHGLKRHSLVYNCKKMDFVKGFRLDVMHRMDEGVAKQLLFPVF